MEQMGPEHWCGLLLGFHYPNVTRSARKAESLQQHFLPLASVMQKDRTRTMGKIPPAKPAQPSLLGPETSKQE